METLLAAPVALGYLLYRWQAGTLHFAHDGRLTDALLLLLGVVTAVPLILFAAGAQRLRLVTVGFFQYLAPSMTFLLALFVFDEPLGKGQLLSFLFIWAGIAVYTMDSVRGDPAKPVTITTGGPP
jgi:chloramphenicol-sensitive protein RarD